MLVRLSKRYFLGNLVILPYADLGSRIDPCNLESIQAKVSGERAHRLSTMFKQCAPLDVLVDGVPIIRV